MVLMNTTFNRFQAWSGLSLSTLLLLVSLISFLTYPSPSTLRSPNPDAAHASLNITSLSTVYGRSVWHMDRTPQEFLEVEFDIRSDLTGRGAGAGAGEGEGEKQKRGRSIWNWNTKQVFLWLEAEWMDHDTLADTDDGSQGSAAPGRLNRAVVWDRIVHSRDEAANVLVQDANKYGVRIIGKKWDRVPTVSFTLKWNLMPKVGLLAYGHEVSTGQIAIPQRNIDYTGDAEQQQARSREMRRMPY